VKTLELEKLEKVKVYISIGQIANSGALQPSSGKKKKKFFSTCSFQKMSTHFTPNHVKWSVLSSWMEVRNVSSINWNLHKNMICIKTYIYFLFIYINVNNVINSPKFTQMWGKNIKKQSKITLFKKKKKRLLCYKITFWYLESKKTPKTMSAQPKMKTPQGLNAITVYNSTTAHGNPWKISYAHRD